MQEQKKRNTIRKMEKEKQLDKDLKKADRKSTRLNSSHGYISYAVFCLKKKTELQSRLNLVCRLLLEKKRRKRRRKKKRKKRSRAQ